MKVRVKETFMTHKHGEKDTITLQTGSVYKAEKIISTTGNIFYILSAADLILDANDFHKYFSIVRERTSIKNAVEQIQSMDHAIEKLADVTVPAIYEDNDNNRYGYGIAEDILNTFSDCETEKEFKIANDMLISICGYSIETLLTKIKEKEQSEEIER